VIEQPCQTCGKPDSPFGYGPPGWLEEFWRCGDHRLEGPVIRAAPIPPTPPWPPPEEWPPVYVELGPKQIAFSDEVGRMRRRAAIARGRAANNGMEGTEDELVLQDICGARCECAGWKYLSPCTWHHGVVDDIHSLPDLNDWIEIKGTDKYDYPTLIVPPKDKNTKQPPPLEWAYVLVNGKNHPIYEIVGWQWGHEFLNDAHWDTVTLRSRPAWRALRPYRQPAELLTLVREREGR
jgi:hypothetical protein